MMWFVSPKTFSWGFCSHEQVAYRWTVCNYKKLIAEKKHGWGSDADVYFYSESCRLLHRCLVGYHTIVWMSASHYLPGFSTVPLPCCKMLLSDPQEISGRFHSQPARYLYLWAWPHKGTFPVPLSKMLCSSSEQRYSSETSQTQAQHNLQMPWGWCVRHCSSPFHLHLFCHTLTAS